MEQPVLARATARVQALNDTGTNPLPAFAVFPSMSNENLLKVATDSCINLNGGEGPPLETLCLIRATELAQAE